MDRHQLNELFLSPIDDCSKYFIILYVAMIYTFFVPQHFPTDWDLNTVGFWSDIPHTYKNPNFVYPPWGLILMLPYKLMHAAGARFFSVLVVGWLSIRQKWSLLKFFSVVLSPYFIFTMSYSNMDILVLVLPVLLWEAVARTRWQNIGWGLALSILLLKPQGAVLIWLYLIRNSRKVWKELLIPLGMVALIIIPVSLLGSPPLILQWINNIIHPSNQNLGYWSVNNISLTSKFTLPGAMLVLFSVSLILLLFIKFKKINWTNNHTNSSLLFISMFLSPYTSQQSVSAALAFIPSWGAVLLSTMGYFVWSSYYQIYFDYLPLFILFLAVSSLILFVPQKIRD